MSEILAENLSGKTVMGADGAELGMLYNVTMDLKTGTLQNLIVDPGESGPRESPFERNDHGHFLVPIGDVQAVRDHIVVAR
ncbi:MAG: PRC-barrel domain-containing protein [Haloglomus sp.]